LNWPWSKNKERIDFLVQKLDESLSKHNDLVEVVKDIKFDVKQMKFIEKVVKSVVEKVMEKLDEHEEASKNKTPVS